MSKKSAFSIRNLCRTCMAATVRGEGDTNTGKQQHIFEKPAKAEEESPTIMEILVSVQPQIKVQTNDDLPKIMCNGCVEQLQLTHHFLEMYKEANEKLHKLLKEVDFNDYKSLAESEEFEDTIVYDDTEREHIEEENEAHKYEVEIEEIPDHMPAILQSDTLDIDEANVEVHDWPGFEEEPVHDISEEDEGKAEFFDNPYSDASDSEWATMNIKKSKKQSIKRISSKPKSVSNNSIRNHKSNKVGKGRVLKELKDEKEDEQLPPANEDGSISCQLCESIHDNITLWREHMQEHPLEKSHKRSEHTKVGRPKKSYECEYCGKVFPKVTAYKNHIRTHTGEEPYLCIECGKSFKVVSSLNTHMLRHRGDRKFQCPHCPKKFVVASGLYGHMMVHNKEKPYVCDVCGSAFHMAYMLKKHNLYHKGIKNFPCEYCELRFVTAEKQRRHMRTHTGEKPYRCKYCDRAFAQSNDCNKHLKQHLGDNIYQCELCPMRFPLARDLRVHFATHKDDDEETRAHNLEARVAEEKNLTIKLGIKEV